MNRSSIRFNPKPCPQPGDGVHSWIYHAACCAVDAELSNEEAIEEIESLMTRDPVSATAANVRNRNFVGEEIQ